MSDETPSRAALSIANRVAHRLSFRDSWPRDEDHQWAIDEVAKLVDKGMAAHRDALRTAEARVAALADGRNSLAQEIRGALKSRGFWAPENASDLIGAVGAALDAAKPPE